MHPFAGNFFPFALGFQDFVDIRKSSGFVLPSGEDGLFDIEPAIRIEKIQEERFILLAEADVADGKEIPQIPEFWMRRF